MIHCNEITGIDTDYMNAWSALLVIQMRITGYGQIESEFFDELNEPIQKYREYIKDKNDTIQARQLIDIANPHTLTLLDKLVDEYNSLPLQAKTNLDTLKIYYSRCSKIMLGIDK